MKKKWVVYVAVAAFLGIASAESTYHVQIPLQFGSTDTPYTHVQIEGENYLLEFDLGSKFQLTLRENCLEKVIQKEPYKVGTWKDIKGNSYEAPSYLIPEMQIGDLTIRDIIAQQDNDDFIFNTTIWDAENKGRAVVDKQQGAIGRPLLEKVNLLLDFNHSILFASNDKDQLKKAGYALDEMIKVPFELGRIGITLRVDTDIGVKRLAIDTGCSINLIRSLLVQDRECEVGPQNIPFFISSKSVIGGKDFGSMRLYLHDITPELHELDGFLGTPFLDNHIVYIDFPNKVAYIASAQ